MLEKMLALQNKRKKEGGFTLVELIVVLVILAILAALLIPALTGYIDKAKEKQVTAECRQVVMAAQTLYDEEYAKVTDGSTISFNATANATTHVIGHDAVATLAEVTATNISTIEANANKISKVVYTNNKLQCTFDGKSYKCEKVS